ncbi:unnamed protein product [Prunus brigantina]
MASLIAEGIEFGKAAPVVFVSSEEVSIFLNLVLANQHACFKASLCSVLNFLLSTIEVQTYYYYSRSINTKMAAELFSISSNIFPDAIQRLRHRKSTLFRHMVTTYASVIMKY